jgi:hypothetical protein
MSINIFVAIEISKFLFRKETSDKEMINLFRKNQSLSKKNNISFRKKSSLCSNSSKLSKEFFEIKNVSLNVLTSKNINFRINVVNIIQEKRVQKFSKDFANTTWINEKMTRIFVFHTINNNRLQYENVKIRNKNDVVIWISHQQFVKIVSALKSYVAKFACWKIFENCADEIRRYRNKKNVKNR